MISKSEISEIDSLLHGGISRLTKVMEKTESSVMFGDTLEMEQCISFMKDIKTVTERELKPSAVAVTGTA